MGLLDKMKSAAAAATGSSAKVSIEYQLKPMRAGDVLPVKVTVMSNIGKEVKSAGVFVDIYATESGQIKCKHCGQMTQINSDNVKQAIPVGPAFTLQPGETKVFEASITIPPGQPTYNGQVSNTWKIRGRLDAFGNDPDSGFQTIEIR